jgi:WD40 repeat protein
LHNFAARSELDRIATIGSPALCVAFSPDGKTVAVSSEATDVWIWEPRNGRIMTLSGNGPHIFTVAFSPDGKLLATTTMAANEVRLWDLPSLSLVAQLRGHVAGVVTVAFSPDGKTLATGANDRKIKLWNVATRQEVATLSSDTTWPLVDFSPDGRILTEGSLDNWSVQGRRIQALRAPSFEEIAAAEAHHTGSSFAPRQGTYDDPQRIPVGVAR